MDYPSAIAIVGSVAVLAGTLLKIFGRDRKASPDEGPIVSILAEQIDGLESRIERLEGVELRVERMAGDSDRLATVDGEVSAMRDHISDLRTRVSVVETEQANTAAAVKELTRTIERQGEDQKTRTGKLHEKLDRLIERAAGGAQPEGA